MRSRDGLAHVLINRRPGAPTAATSSSAARFAKLAAKYGPHAVAAAKVGGPMAKEALANQQRRIVDRRHAIDKARTVTDGSVLRLREGDAVAWVVFAGDEPVAAFPDTGAQLEASVARADLGKRMTPEEFDATRAPAKARRAAQRARPQRRKALG